MCIFKYTVYSQENIWILAFSRRFHFNNAIFLETFLPFQEKRMILNKCCISNCRKLFQSCLNSYCVKSCRPAVAYFIIICTKCNDKDGISGVTLNFHHTAVDELMLRAFLPFAPLYYNNCSITMQCCFAWDVFAVSYCVRHDRALKWKRMLTGKDTKTHGAFYVILYT